MALPNLPQSEQETNNGDEELGGSMTFLEHLEELRSRLIKSLMSLAIAAFVCFFVSGELLDVMMRPYYWGIGVERQPLLNLKDQLAPAMDWCIEKVTNFEFFESEEIQSDLGEVPVDEEEEAGPAPRVSEMDEMERQLLKQKKRLVALSMLEVFMVRVKLSIVAGIFIAFPIIFFQAWKFIAPGLYRREKKFIFPTITSAWFCFIVGGLFAYFIVLPMAVYFFSSLSGPTIDDMWSVDKYFTNALHIMLAFGVVFEEPVVITLLAYIGLARYKHLKKFRPYVIVGMFVLAAILTPPDPISQLMCVIPLVVLYEISGIGVRLIERARGVKDDDDETDDL